MPPDTFIPIVESSRLIVPLGAWVLERACQDIAQWNRDRTGESPLMVAVNVSAVQLHDDGLAEQVSAAASRANLDPRLLVLEITETALMTDAEAAMSTITALKEVGVRVAVDDFGTGYSSLGYLNRFPVDLLKIDGEFIAKVTEGPEEAAIAHAIVKLADTLELEVVAEGVEMPEHRKVLLDWGCHLGQGYLYSPPLPGAFVSRWLGAAGSSTVADAELRDHRADGDRNGDVGPVLAGPGHVERAATDGHVGSGAG